MQYFDHNSQQEVTRPKAMFEHTLPEKSIWKGGGGSNQVPTNLGYDIEVINWNLQ